MAHMAGLNQAQAEILLDTMQNSIISSDEAYDQQREQEEVNGLSDKKLALAQRLLRVKSKEEVLKALLPEKTIVKTVTSAVTSTVKSVAPTLNKKVTKEETSDEAILADDSE